MKISILHPSRARAAQAQKAFINWVGNCSKKLFNIEYILSLDLDDKDWPDYIWSNGLHVIYSPNKNVVQAANAAAKVATGDILVLISDDFESFPGWDKAVVEALDGKSGVLKTFDGVQRWIVTLPIMTKDYYNAQGYLYYPGYHHMFCDTDQTHKADLEGKLIMRRDIVFKHNHYSVKGGPKKDEINVRADGTWGQGEKVYLQRCKDKFGLSVKSVYDLSPEATQAGHIGWMRKKGVR